MGNENDALLMPAGESFWIDWPNSKQVPACGAKLYLGDFGVAYVVQREMTFSSFGAATYDKCRIKLHFTGGRADKPEVKFELECRKFREALIEANEVLRSASAVATRKGGLTKWNAFTKRLSDVMARQFKLLQDTGGPYNVGELESFEGDETTPQPVWCGPECGRIVSSQKVNRLDKHVWLSVSDHSSFYQVPDSWRVCPWCGAPRPQKESVS